MHVACIDGDNIHGCLKNNKVDSNIAKYDLLKILQCDKHGDNVSHN